MILYLEGEIYECEVISNARKSENILIWYFYIFHFCRNISIACWRYIIMEAKQLINPLIILSQITKLQLLDHLFVSVSKFILIFETEYFTR